MKIKHILLILLVASKLSISAQDEVNDTIDPTTLHIWNPKKEFHYRAFYIDVNGDTLTNEKIILKPMGKSAPVAYGEPQIILNFRYNYTEQDSIRFFNEPIYQTRYTRKKVNQYWRKTVPEGAIENDRKLWMHPFRMNQYVLTEVSPFPEINLPAKTGKKWATFLFVKKVFGKFKGIHKQYYEITGESKKTYPFAESITCWQVTATSKHRKLGESKAIIFYNQDYGFTEINNTFYNGQKINFILEKVIATD